MSPTTSRAASPTTTPLLRPRAASPPQRNFSPSFTNSRLRSSPSSSSNNNNNASTTSLSLAAPATAEQREVLRHASSVLVKEMLKPPSQVRGESGLGPKEYDEVEWRLRNLARLERVWGRSGSSGFLGVGAMQMGAGVSSASSSATGLSTSGEERERRYFCEALSDGYVLCQCVFHFFVFLHSYSLPLFAWSPQCMAVR